MKDRIPVRSLFLAAVLAAIILSIATTVRAGDHHGGPGWEQRLGITGDAAYRNAQLIRRAQNRRTRDIDRVNNYDIDALVPRQSRYR